MPLFLILFGAVFTAASSVALGILLLRPMRRALSAQESLLFGFLAGAACHSLLIFVICACGWARPWVFLVLGAAILTTWRPIASAIILPPLSLWQRWFYGSILGAWGAAYFIFALAPETSPDGITYHLGLVSRYVREGGFQRITTDLYASMPQGAEMLFVPAFAFGRHSAAKLVHFAFFAALPLLMICYGRRFQMPSAGLCGAALVFAAPVAALDGTSAYNDLAGASAAFGVFYLLEIWDGEDRRLPALAGLLAGFALSIKYTLAAAPVYALVVVLRRSRHRLADAGAVAAPAAAMIAPWLWKNWLWVGNPFSPFLNQLFPNPYVDLSFEKDYTLFLRLPAYYRLDSYWDLPLALTVKGNLTGVLGPVFLLAPLALAALRRPAGRRLLGAAAMFAAVYPANLGCRFLLPALPFVGLALGMTLEGRRFLAPAVALLHAVSVIPAVQDLYCRPLNFQLPEFPLRAALRLIPEDEYLRRALPAYLQARLIEEQVPPGARVFALDDVATAYTSRDIVGPYQSALSWRARDALEAGLRPEAAPAVRLSFRFGERSVRRLRFVQNGAADRESWSVHEIRLYRRGREIPRKPWWRAEARPNPWDAGLAVDRNAATRWRTWQAFRPGMYLELDLGEEIAADEAALETSPGQAGSRVTLDGASPVVSAQEAPAGMLGDAVGELQRLGIRYLFVADGNPVFPGFDPGFPPAAQAAGARLYRLADAK